MKNDKLNPLSAQDDDSVTYVPGLGFVSNDNGRNMLRDIRVMANLLCLLLFLYFFCQRVFALPLTYLAYVLGLDVTVNRFTGMVASTPMTQLIIVLLTNGLSLLAVTALCGLLARQELRLAKPFRRPVAGLTGIALPIAAAAGVLGASLAVMFSRVLELFGLVIYTEPAPITTLEPVVLLSIGGTLLLNVVEEILFHGFALTALRKFGDGFAVISCSLFFAFRTDNAIEAICAFVFSLAAGYFVVRSGSVWVAVYSRLLVSCLFYSFRIAYGMLESSLAAVVVLLACLVLVGMAVVSYLHFVRLDDRAFFLLRPDDRISTKAKLGAFCGSLFFLLLLVRMLIRLINTIQIIG